MAKPDVEFSVKDFYQYLMAGSWKAKGTDCLGQLLMGRKKAFAWGFNMRFLY